MKNLNKIPRNYSAKFCYLGFENHDYNDMIDDKVELTPAGKDKKEELNNQESITRALSATEMGAQKLPESFRKIKASEFLKRSAEELRILFITDGTIDFRGNSSAQRSLGLTDLFPKVSKKQQFVVVDGINYAYGARRHDGKIGYGNPNYKSITGGENIEHFIAEAKSQSFVKSDTKKEKSIPKYDNFAGFSTDYLSSMENLSPEQEVQEKTKFSKNLELTEKLDAISLQQEKQLGLNENMQFKQKMGIIAKKIGETYNLPWEVIYAQGALESGRGKSGLSRQENNYFGIKGGTGKSWSTLENYGNGLERTSAKFRGYSSMYESAVGYAKFIHKNSRYKKAVSNYQQTKNSLQFLVDIKSAGYATDANYVTKVASVFKTDFGYTLPSKRSQDDSHFDTRVA